MSTESSRFIPNQKGTHVHRVYIHRNGKTIIKNGTNVQNDSTNDVIPDKTCSHVYSTGIKTGQKCRVIVTDTVYCATHNPGERDVTRRVCKHRVIRGDFSEECGRVVRNIYDIKCRRHRFMPDTANHLVSPVVKTIGEASRENEPLDDHNDSKCVEGIESSNASDPATNVGYTGASELSEAKFSRDLAKINPSIVPTGAAETLVNTGVTGSVTDEYINLSEDALDTGSIDAKFELIMRLYKESYITHVLERDELETRRQQAQEAEIKHLKTKQEIEKKHLRFLRRKELMHLKELLDMKIKEKQAASLSGVQRTPQMITDIEAIHQERLTKKKSTRCNNVKQIIFNLLSIIIMMAICVEILAPKSDIFQYL